MSAIDVFTIQPFSRAEAEQLAATEYARFAAQLRSLEGDEWAKPTDCSLWDVRAMVGHSVGMMSDFTSFRSLLRRMTTASRAAKRAGGPLVDAMTALQVAETAELTHDELIAHCERLGPIAARWRASAPTVFRRIRIKETVGGEVEKWRIGYLLDTILTRDPWMHRVDIARATGRDLDLTVEHDGRIVADVVAEWARRHGQPFRLTLTGPVGCEFMAGGGAGDELTLDAIEFCRTLSGRAHGDGLLNQEVPF